MPSCAVQGCSESKASLHRLPVKDVERGKRWLAAIKNPNYDENIPLELWRNIRVCSKHFKPEDFKTDFRAELMGIKSRAELKEDAIPSIFPWTDGNQAGESSPALRRNQAGISICDVGCQYEPPKTRHCGVQVFDLPKTKNKSIQTLPERKSVSNAYVTEEALRASMLSEVTVDSESTFHPDTGLCRWPPSRTVNKYIVDEDCLLDLFRSCPLCSRTCNTFVVGTSVIVGQVCPHCGFKRQWEFNPK